jgi:hypothetical protein
MKRRVYQPRIIGDKVMMPADLKRLRGDRGCADGVVAWQRACQHILAHADVFAVRGRLSLRHHLIAADLQFCCPA